MFRSFKPLLSNECFFKILMHRHLIMFPILPNGAAVLIIRNVSCRSQTGCRLWSKRYCTGSTENTLKGKRFQWDPQQREPKKLDPSNLYLLIFPIFCFGLGVWQIQRKSWKENIIARLNSRINSKPVPLPENYDELKDMEYCPVTVKGKFLNDVNLYFGPKSLVEPENKRKSALFGYPKPGFLIVTPFKLSSNGKLILVNRGWVPHDQFKNNPNSFSAKSEEMELTGIVRHSEKGKIIGMGNDPSKNHWIYRDINEMAMYANTEPVFIDAVTPSSDTNTPIPGQTLITLRNEHRSYIITWFGLSAASLFFWYLKYVR